MKLLNDSELNSPSSNKKSPTKKPSVGVKNSTKLLEPTKESLLESVNKYKNNLTFSSGYIFILLLLLLLLLYFILILINYLCMFHLNFERFSRVSTQSVSNGP